MSIRKYVPQDYDQVVSLFRVLPELFTPRTIRNVGYDLKDYERGDFRNILNCLVFSQEEEIQGALIYRQDYTGDRVFELKWMAVKKEKQLNSIGRSLIRYAENLLKNKARLIVLYTSNTPIWDGTKDFFRKLGYQEVAIVPDFWDDGDDRAVFWKRVDSGV